jgi:parvulin-like peptidyl-prolyl cis-trans isomerase-like protein
MSSRGFIRFLSHAFVLAAFLSLPWAGAARAAMAPADSTAASAPADSASAKEEMKDAKEDAKDAIKEESKKEESKSEEVRKESKKGAEAAKKESKKAADAAKKAAKKSKAAAEKGTKSMESASAMPGTMPVKPATPPQHVQVQHILIGFSGSVPGKTITRSKDEAKTLAYQILERARKGEDFDELVKQYTDDSPPGIYGMSEKGLPPGPGEYPRDGMVAAFGNVGFNISVGNIGIADYDPQASPFGWHIIKRLK